MDRKGRVRASLVAVASLWAAACGAPGPPPRNVLLILVDTLRGDRLSCYGYERPTTPRLDALAAEGAVFLNHYAQGSHTRVSLPSLTYSRYFAPPLFPSSSRVELESPSEVFERLDGGAVALPRALASGGRRTVLVNTHPWLRERTEFARLHEEVVRVRERRDPETGDPGRPIAPADDMVDAAIRWLGDNGDSPFYMHLHLMDMHEPLFYTEDAEQLWGEELAGDPRRWKFSDFTLNRRQLDDEEIALLNAAYDGTARFVDRELGRLMDFLRDAKLLDSTLVVVTADHGEMLYERGSRRGHGGLMYESVARVPLILHYPPRIAPQRVEELTESIDVMPTILALTGDELGDGRWMDGIDLFDRQRLTARRYVMSPTFVRGPRYKLLLHYTLVQFLRTGRHQPLRGELYDLRADPGEHHDLWANRPEVVEELLGVYRDELATPFRRFDQARVDEQPEGGFAIAAEHFQLSPRSGPQRGWKPTEAGWELLSPRGERWLAATEGAEPIEVAFEVPSGTYELLVEGRGEFTVMAGIDPECGNAQSARLDFDHDHSRWWREKVGQVSVCGARFHCRLIPRGKAVVSYFGFQPVGDEGSVAPEDEERDRQLEALGYVN